MKMDNPTTITVIGGVIAALVIAIFTYWAGVVQKRQSDTDKNDLINANKEIAQKSDLLREISQQQTSELRKYADSIESYSRTQKSDDEAIKGLQRELLDKTNEVADLYRKLDGYQSGTGSYCLLQIMKSGPEPNKYMVFASMFYKNKDHNPIHNLDICLNAIQDHNITIDEAGINPNNTHSYSIDVIGGSEMQTRVLGSISFDSKNDAPYFSIQFSTRDGKRKWYQRTILLENRSNEKFSNGILVQQCTQVYELGDIIPSNSSNSYVKQNLLLEVEKDFDWSKYYHIGCIIYENGVYRREQNYIIK